MKVLLITPDFAPDVGGIQKLLYNFAKYTRFKVTVIAPFTKGARVFDKRQKFEIIRVPKLSIGLRIKDAEFRIRLWPLFMCLKSIEIAIKEKPDVLLCGHIIVGPIGYLIDRIFGISYAVYTYGLEIMGVGVGRRLALTKCILRHSQVVFTVSEFCKKQLLELDIKENRIKKIYPGIEVNFFAPNIDPTPVIEKYDLQGKKIILTVSRLDAKERYKGHDETLRVLGSVIKEFPSLKYIIVGNGTDKARLESLVRELNLTNYVLFAGGVSDFELTQLYTVCDFFIMASKEVKTDKRVKAEGFGIVYAEAGACGKPVIAGKSGGTVEAVIDGVTGLVVEPDEESIGRAMIKLLEDEALRKRLGMQARHRVVQELEARKIANEVENTLLLSIKSNK